MEFWTFLNEGLEFMTVKVIVFTLFVRIDILVSLSSNINDFKLVIWLKLLQTDPDLGS